MKRSLIILVILLVQASCTHSQNKPGNEFRLAGGPCEGCEAIFEYGDMKLSPVDTLPDYTNSEDKIKISGTVYQPDGKTPAKDVVLYIYHTDKQGVYPTKGDETGWAKRHGYLRGWVKTDTNGKYTFYTHKPGAYPGRTAPAHIHLTILEPDGKYYWLGDYHFEGDSLLTEKDRNPTSPRGGSNGLLKLDKENELWTGIRNIILGKNVPDYE